MAALVTALASAAGPAADLPRTTEAMRNMASSKRAWSLSFRCRICSSNQLKSPPPQSLAMRPA